MIAARRAASISAAVALVLAAVWAFWPQPLGGGTTYVSTHGISMEPRFHTGDLAILRSAPSYAVGDVVAYRSVSLNTVVMHRIVDLDGDRFVIQGDNNDWLDQDHPSRDQVLGTLFVRIPQGGKVLASVTSPAGVGLVAAVGIALLGAAHRPRSRHAVRRARRRPAPRAPSLPAPVRAYARQAVVTSGAVTLV